MHAFVRLDLATDAPKEYAEELMSDDEELKKLQLENAKLQLEAARVDLETKRFDLARRPSALRNALTNPVAIAAIIAALVTLSSAIVSSVVAWQQNMLARERAVLEKSVEQHRAEAQMQLEQLKMEIQLVMDAIRTGDADAAARNLSFLVQAGLVNHTAPRLTQYLANRPTGVGAILPPASGDRLDKHEASTK
jgi:hypothetical protein